MQNSTNQNEILFQKLGNTWYAFTEINNDVVYSALPDGVNPKTTKMELYHVIEKHMRKVANLYENKNTSGMVA